MSLAYNASPWISDNPQQTQKRTPTIRKTLKKMPLPQPEFMAQPGPENTNDNIGMYNPPISGSSYMSQEQVYKMGGESQQIETESNTSNLAHAPTPQIMETIKDQENRQSKINDLLNKMNTIQIDNDGNHLANFKPLDNISNLPTDLPPIQPLPPMFQTKPQEPSKPTFSANMSNLEKIAQYHQAYESPSNVASWAAGSSRQNNSGNVMIGNNQEHTEKLLDKINYMIHLLEAQQNEKTNNTLEEFVMFSLVGVFIIYVLDSFTRSARYTR